MHVLKNCFVLSPPFIVDGHMKCDEECKCTYTRKGSIIDKYIWIDLNPWSNDDGINNAWYAWWEDEKSADFVGDREAGLNERIDSWRDSAKSKSKENKASGK